MCADVDLLLGRNTVEATTAGITVDNHYAEAVACILADTFECSEGTLVDKRLEVFCACDEALFFRTCFADDIVEVGFFLVENMSLVCNLLVGVLNIGCAVADHTVDLADVFLSKLDFEGLIFDFLGQVVEFVVVAHVVELLAVTVDKEFFILYLVHFGHTLGFELLNFVFVAFDARVKAGNRVFEVLHLLRELAAHIADTVDFRQDSLKFEKGFEALFYRARCFGFLICCHNYVYRYFTGFVSISDL